MERFLGSVLERALHRTLTRYFENLDITALRLSPFAGDVVLTNLTLRVEALRAAGLPLSFERGFVRELRIRVPWLKLQSEAIEVLIDTVEVICSSSADDEHAAAAGGSTAAVPISPQPQSPPPPSGDAASRAADARSGDSWVQSLVQRALHNAVLRVRNAVVKLVDGRVVASLSLRSLEIYSADARWQRAFVELDGPSRALRKVLELSDLTLCLDERDAASGWVARYERPLLRTALTTLRCAVHLNPERRRDGYPTVSLDLLVHSWDASLSEAQLGLLGTLSSALQAARAARAEAAKAEAAKAEAARVEAARVEAEKAEVAKTDQAVTVSGGADGDASGGGGSCDTRPVFTSEEAPAAAAPADDEEERPRGVVGRAAGWVWSVLMEDDDEYAPRHHLRCVTRPPLVLRGRPPLPHMAAAHPLPD